MYVEKRIISDQSAAYYFLRFFCFDKVFHVKQLYRNEQTLKNSDSPLIYVGMLGCSDSPVISV
jgi:hypothetical protein